MKSLFNYITLASIILSGGALAEEVVGKWGTKNSMVLQSMAY